MSGRISPGVIIRLPDSRLGHFQDGPSTGRLWASADHQERVTKWGKYPLGNQPGKEGKQRIRDRDAAINSQAEGAYLTSGGADFLELQFGKESPSKNGNIPDLGQGAQIHNEFTKSFLLPYYRK